MLNLFAVSSNSQLEEQRLREVRYYSCPDARQDAALDNLVQLIAQQFSVPMASVAIIGKKDVMIKAAVGMDGKVEMSREESLCSLSLTQDDPTVLENALEYPEISQHPFVAGELGIRFYASAPVRSPGGFTIGAVCIGDLQPRRFSLEQRAALARFAATAMHQIELRAEICRREQLVADRENQLREAFRVAKIGTWEFDMVTQKATWSDELYAVYEIEKQDNVEYGLDTYLSMVHPEDLPVITKWLHCPESMVPFNTERLINHQGKILYIHSVRQKVYDEDGRLVKLTGISQNITERVEYEQKLKDSENRFKALVQNSSDMIAVVDEKGNIKYISPTSLRISGYTPEELTGRNVFEFMHEEDMPVLTTELEKLAKNHNSGKPTLHRFRTKSNEWIWFETKGMNMTSDENIGGIIINARDVTERKRLEEIFAVTQQNLQRAITSAVIKAQESERSVLGRELHDNVNQVLTTVKLYIEMISDGVDDYKAVARKAAFHLQNCIDEIRRISRRLSAPTLDEISLEESIRELIESINLTNRSRIVFHSTGLEEITVSQELHLAVYRIIQEQLNNILKHASALHVVISLVCRDERLWLQVTDNGRGFDPQARRSGIGITNMRTRAENLSGQLTIVSAPGKGCQLSASFPLKQDHSEAVMLH